MVKLAVIGKDVSQSTSPQIHNFIARELGLEMTYGRISIEESAFEDRIEELLSGYDGLNVTIPYKLSVIPHLKGVEGDAAAFGAVNTVLTSTRTGYNTDGLGFMQMLKAEGVDAAGKDVLVLGAGGGAWAVTSALKAAGVNVYVLNRSAVPAAKLCTATGCELYANQKTELAVNCTSVGADGDILRSLCVIPRFEYAFDLAYSGETPFLAKCRDGGSLVANGYDMLVYQAIDGDKFLFGEAFADTERIFDKAKSILLNRK